MNKYDYGKCAFPKNTKTKIRSKKVSDSRRYSILTEDLNCCIECGKYGINKHEIFGGANRERSKRDGLVIPLCTAEHHNQYDCKGIHFDKKLMQKWREIGQQAWQDYYNKTKEDFIKEYGKNYL